MRPISRPARARLALPALALVAVTALAGCGGEETSPPSGGSDPTSTSSTSSSPEGSGGGGGGQEQSGADATLDVTVDGDQLSPNAEEIDLAPGETLAVTVESDRSGELHVHSSPEQYVEFGEGETTQDLTFDTPGSIEIEEHESGAVVAMVEVS